jgi:hypothetical protein
LLELADLLAHACLDRIGVREMLERNLHGNLHQKLLVASLRLRFSVKVGSHAIQPRRTHAMPEFGGHGLLRVLKSGFS